MSEETKPTTIATATEQPQVEDKGKAPVTEDLSMDEESSSDEDQEVSRIAVFGLLHFHLANPNIAQAAQEQPLEEADDDNMEEIDESNIITGGRRTRGKNIDFAKAAQELGDDEEDEEDDDDFEEPEDDMKE